MPYGRRIGLRDIRALQPGSVVWDATLPGFGARRSANVVAYVLKYRTRQDHRQRWVTIGRHGAPWTPDLARAEAKRLLGEVVAGRDPATEKHARRSGLTVAELCACYLADAEAGRLLLRSGRPKNPRTLLNDRIRITNHVVPLLGRLRVTAITKADIEGAMHSIAAGGTKSRGGRGVARRTMTMFGAILTYAVERGLRADNPASRLRKFAEGRRERRLSEE
jgi:hypothetical protein